MKYTLTIGLEIHAELKTGTKMFCDSKNDPDEKTPNLNICPICLAHPGTLPVINKEAVRQVLMVGIAVNAKIADFTEFDRKNYFYPDLAKGYQISQYEFPLISGGKLNGVEITRIHLEEDTARSIHTTEDSSSLVDFNRAGIPLMELVTDPVIKDSKQAGDFARELQLLLRTLNVSNANMEKGEMRVEANISVSKDSKFGTKVEVKNINSFKAVEKAIEYEMKRQIEILESGGELTQETRGWDEDRQVTFSQRAKEESADYRYFPDPDLPKLKISEIPEFTEQFLRMQMPQLPTKIRNDYKDKFGIRGKDIEVYIIDRTLGKFFEDVASELMKNEQSSEKIQLASNYITNNLVTLRNSLNTHITKYIDPASFARIVDEAYADEISSNAAVEILIQLAKDKNASANIESLINERRQKSDETELKMTIQQIIIENPDVVDEYKSGKETAINFLVGQGMKILGGNANPTKLQDILKQELTN